MNHRIRQLTDFWLSLDMALIKFYCATPQSPTQEWIMILATGRDIFEKLERKDYGKSN